jgi:AraC family transcriptional regulator
MPSVSIGSSRSVLERGDFSVSEVSIPESAGTLAPHRHDRAQVHLVLEGEYFEDARDGRHALGPGSILFRPAGEVHSNVFANGEIHGVLLEFEGEAAAAVLPGLASDAPFYLAPHAVDSLRTGFEREARREDVESKTALAGLVLCLASEVSRLGRAAKRPGPPPWLGEAAALIRRRSADDWRLTRLASAVGVTPVRLAAAFRRHFGCSVGDYLQNVRVDCARRRLAASDAAIGEIALECGFFDQAHLTRVFRKRLGTTPAGFRRSHRG